MRELARAIVYRPLLLPLLMLVWVIWGGVCRALPFSFLFTFLFLFPLLYFFLLRWLRVDFRYLRFGLLLLFAFLLSSSVALRIDASRNNLEQATAVLGSPSARRPETLLVRVAGFPRSSFKGWRLRLVPLTGNLVSLGEIELELPAVVYDSPLLPRVGDLLSVKLELKPLKPPRHPFLRGAFQRRRFSGIVATADLEDWSRIVRVARFRGGPGAVESLRRRLYGLIFRSAGDDRKDAAAILAAVLIGCRDQLGTRVKNLFLDFGVYHLFAISGLHLSIVAGLLLWLGQRLVPIRLRRRLPTGPLPAAIVLTLAILPLYLFLTGFHLPVVRAGIMVAIFLLALLKGRLQDPFSTLMLAAIVILWLWPESLFGLSFQLSFTAVATILWLLPRLRRWWEAGPAPFLRGRRLGSGSGLLRYLFYYGSTSLAISLATLPWLISQVHFISPYSLPANLILIPLFSLVVIPVGMAALLLASLLGFMQLLFVPLVGLLHCLLEGAFFLQARLPGRRWYGPQPTGFEEVLLLSFILILVFWVTYPKARKMVVCGLLILFMAVLGDWAWWSWRQSRPRVSLAAFVGGRPQSLLLEMPGGEALLFNGGSYTKSGFSFPEKVIAPYCWRRRITRIPVLVLTEPQRGLVGGLLFLVEHFKVEEIWYHGIWSGYPPFRDFNRITRDRFGVRWRKLTSFSSSWIFNGVEISVAGPPANDFVMAESRRQNLLDLAPSLNFRYDRLDLLVWGGGQVDDVQLPREVNLLALLVAPGSRHLPPGLGRVGLRDGGILLTPGGRSRSPVRLLPVWKRARRWRVKEDGFLFLALDREGRCDDKMPADLISGCQSDCE
ncbi:MAG: hypothetical protein GXO34_00785 [Deltaproteobacteria bacterium]|nr:hypothetical protein [Deltaproteobacteria bacterium]